MLLVVGYSFLAGLVTILAPCVWPLLPIVLSSSVSGGSRKPLGIAIGIISAFGILTLTIAYVVKIIPFDPGILRLFSFTVISLSGLMLIFPRFSGSLEAWFGKITGRFAGAGGSPSSGLGEGLIVGISLGIVWTPCAGPILATIAILAATQRVSWGTVIVTIFYLLGAGIPLFLFASFGNRIFKRVKLSSPFRRSIQVVFGGIMMVTAVLIISGFDRVLSAKLLNAFPSVANDLISLESNPRLQDSLNSLKGKISPEVGVSDANSRIINSGMPILEEAPDFTGTTGWINTANPIKIGELRGRVVLVDFWTYTCINCIRTLPHIAAWYDKYKDLGFTVIGIHTPEFEFEKNTDNVKAAARRYKINYPVAQDNSYSTWNSYNNQYWPAEYLIDGKGNIRRTHFGEGEYDKTESAIQKLLAELGNDTANSLVSMPDQTPKNGISSETYLGAKRAEYYYPSHNLSPGVKVYTSSQMPIGGSFSLAGTWDINDDKAVSGERAVLILNYSADKVFLVLRPGSSGNPRIKVLLDGKIIDQNHAGSDVSDGLISVDSDRLYNLIDTKGKPENHLLQLEFLNDGIEAFAFTFG